MPAECERLGVFDEVLDGDEVLDRALHVARRLGGLPPEVYARTKRDLRAPALAQMRDWRSSRSRCSSAGCRDRRPARRAAHARGSQMSDRERLLVAELHGLTGSLTELEQLSPSWRAARVRSPAASASACCAASGRASSCCSRSGATSRRWRRTTRRRTTVAIASRSDCCWHGRATSSCTTSPQACARLTRTRRPERVRLRSRRPRQRRVSATTGISRAVLPSGSRRTPARPRTSAPTGERAPRPEWCSAAHVDQLVLDLDRRLRIGQQVLVPVRDSPARRPLTRRSPSGRRRSDGSAASCAARRRERPVVVSSRIVVPRHS